MNKTIEFTELELAVVKGVLYKEFTCYDDLPESVRKSLDHWEIDLPIILATIEEKPDSFYLELIESIVSKI